jgi:type IV fimbrial biogenesis protein FimT
VEKIAMIFMQRIYSSIQPMQRRSSFAASKRARGFTLLELMFAVVVLAVLLSLAAPSMRNLVLDQRIKTVAGDLHASLIFARSEAIKRNQYVALCAMTDDGWGCQNSADWARGWIIYLDANGDGFPNAVSDILKRQDTLTDISLTGTNANITYQGDGRLRATSLAALPNPAFSAYSDGNKSVAWRCVRLDASGRPNVQTDNNKETDGCQQ